VEEALYDLFSKHVEKSPDVSIYGIFDGVKYPMLWSNLEEGVLVYDMLFREEALREALEEVAPYLVALDFAHEQTITQSKELIKYYGQNGCIFLSSYLSFEETLEMMRELFYVYTPEGEKGYMRFYDPTIFREYIEQKDPNIVYMLFNDIEHYWCEDKEDIDRIIQYTFENKSVTKTTLHPKKETHED